MSTWTSRRLPQGLAATGLLVLAGCFEGFGGFGFGPAAGDAPELAEVTAAEIAVAGPRGYCIDPVGTRENETSAFVLLGSCAALNGSARAAHPDRLAVLTATVSVGSDGPSVADTLAELAAFFETPQGRAGLSRSGAANSVTLLDSRSRDGVLYLRVADTSPFSGPPVADSYVRAIFDVGPHLVTLSVVPLADPALDGDAARALLDEFVRRVRRENRPAPTQRPAAPAPDPQQAGAIAVPAAG